MAAKIPRAQEIIFRSGAVDRRRFLPIDEEHVVAFAPPAILILQHRHGHAHKVPASGCFHPDVVAFAIQILFVIDHGIAVRLPLIRSILSPELPGGTARGNKADPAGSALL